jgi:diguanylate cyclase (GGDEF)-like protein
MNLRKTALVHDPVFRKSHLCSGLSELEFNAITAFLEPRKVKKGEVIVQEGAAGEEMYILVFGKIVAWVSQVDGTQRRMFGLNPGDFFGEMSIIANEARSATIIAEDDTELLVLHAVDFYRVVFEYPMIGKKILNAIIRLQNIWFEQTSQHLGDLMRWGESARRRAISDEMTGLYNRRFLEESASGHFKKNTSGTRNLSLLMMDLDRIHQVNSKYGNRAGDLVFISVAEVLRAATRAGDVCARLAGDEFAVLLPDTGPKEALEIAENIRKIIAPRVIKVPGNPDGTGQAKITIRTSIGVATFPVHTDCWKGLVVAADSALRRAKELGRNRVEIAGKK